MPHIDRNQLIRIIEAAGLEEGTDVLDDYRPTGHHIGNIVAVAGLDNLVRFLGAAARQLDPDQYDELFLSAVTFPTQMPGHGGQPLTRCTYFPSAQVVDF